MRPRARAGRRCELSEQRGLIELAREQTPGARELVWRRSRTSLGLEQLAPLQCAASCVGEMARELEIVLAEDALLREEDDHDAAWFAPLCVDGDREQRAITGARDYAPPLRRESLVVGERRRGEHPGVRCRPSERAVLLVEARFELLGKARRQVVRAASAGRPACGIGTAAPAAPSASAAACATASSVAARDKGRPSTDAIGRAALYARLTRTARERRRVARCERCGPANASSTGLHAGRRSTRAPTPSTPCTSSLQRIGNDRVRGSVVRRVRASALSSPYSAAMSGRPSQIRSPASPRPTGTQSHERRVGPWTTAQRPPRSRS
jgi:hypothetical protein